MSRFCSRLQESGSHRILDLHVLLGDLGGILHAGEGEGLLQESLVAGLELSVGLEEIVVAVAHAQASLGQVQDLIVAVGEVRIDTGGEETAVAVEVHPAEQVGQFIQGGDRLDLGDIRLDRLGTQRVAGGGVERHPVQVGDLLVHGAGLGLQGGHVLEQLVQVRSGWFPRWRRRSRSGRIQA
jgi:hypothetical protein